ALGQEHVQPVLVATEEVVGLDLHVRELLLEARHRLIDGGELWGGAAFEAERHRPRHLGRRGGAPTDAAGGEAQAARQGDGAAGNPATGETYVEDTCWHGVPSPCRSGGGDCRSGVLCPPPGGPRPNGGPYRVPDVHQSSKGLCSYGCAAGRS